VVHLDLRHLGAAYLHERLPQICELAEEYLGIDPATAPIPVLPAAHYTMGGIVADGYTASTLPGLYSAGECSSVGIHGANRLGSNSLTELLVFGKVAGLVAANFAREATASDRGPLLRQADAAVGRALAVGRTGRATERIATLRSEMAQSMENGCGIYRTGPEMQATCDKIAELKERRANLRLDDTSRGSHQRLDGYAERDDANFLQHTMAHYAGEGVAPLIGYADVTITSSPPGTRAYGAAGEQAEAAAASKQPTPEAHHG
jgi:fumarate reductase flavoprotein subunit